MDIEQMRWEIMMAYPDSEKWRIKCQWMSDHQVVAIYKSIRNRNKKKTNKPANPGFEQLKFDLGSLM